MTETNNHIRDVIVIGSGPAGYTAALYAARASLQPLLFEGSVGAGGALMITTDVENYPGFPDGIQGPELMDAMRKQAERFGAELVSEDVTAVDLTGQTKVVRVGEREYAARTVILAMGSGYRRLECREGRGSHLPDGAAISLGEVDGSVGADGNRA